jgi:transposase
MHVETVPNRGARPTILLRQSFRVGANVRKRTLANLTALPAEAIEALRAILKGQHLVPAEEALVIERTKPHGHVKAVLHTLRAIGLDSIIASTPSRQRDLVIAMIVQRLLNGCSKLASTRLWHTTTLAEELSVEEAEVDDLYEAMDWLLKAQPRIEKKLAKRHLREGARVFYDVTSSYYEGRTCALARFGHNRDQKKGRLIIVYGLLADPQGRPIAVEVYPGNTGDPATVGDQVDKLRERFGIQRVVLVGDRGMLTQARIDELREYPQLGWISALRSAAIRELVERGVLHTSLFDHRDLAEITSDAFPDERLIACYNPLLAEERRRKRQELLEATEARLAAIEQEVSRRTRKPLGKAEIALKVGRIINRYKMAKHFKLKIEDGGLGWRRNDEAIEREAALDGMYVIRTSEPGKKLPAAQAVRSYKNLSQVERAFRCFKGLDIRVRPIRHRDDDRVRTHIFLCFLAYYVEWHMRQRLKSVLFDDEELAEDRLTRHPVRPAEPSESAKTKKAERQTEIGMPVHSFDTLLQELGTLLTCPRFMYQLL